MCARVSALAPPALVRAGVGTGTPAKVWLRRWRLQGRRRRGGACAGAQVLSVAAGKHHMLVATTAGEVFSWGSARSGKLGYHGDGDTQPTPKR